MPARDAGLLDLAASVGNRAFAAFVQGEAAKQHRVSEHPHPQLPPGTPAWAQDGEIVLGPPAFLLSREERAEVVHHETIHVLQQRLLGKQLLAQRLHTVEGDRGEARLSARLSRSALRLRRSSVGTDTSSVIETQRVRTAARP